MGKQDGPAVADPFMEIDLALGRVGREIRGFGIDA
jgi:hypothetical protein